MTFQTVGVVGVGQMGSGIVEVFVRAGCEVVAREINDELLERGRVTCSARLRAGSSAARSRRQTRMRRWGVSRSRSTWPTFLTAIWSLKRPRKT